jgi:hypothetical protein
MKPAATIYYITLEQGKGNLTDTTSNRQNYTVERSYGTIVDSFTLSGKDNIIELSAKLKAMGQFRQSPLTANAASGNNVTLNVSDANGITLSDTLNIYDSTPQNETKAPKTVTPSVPSVAISVLTNSYTTANSAKIELLPLTPSFSTAPQYFSFGHVKVQFAGTLSAAASAAKDNLENWEVNFDNKAKELFGTLRFGPSVLQPLGFTISLKGTRYFSNIADRDQFLNLTQQAMILTVDNGVVVSATDTNAAHYQVIVKLPDLRFKSHEMITTTDDLYVVKFEMEGFYDNSNSESMQVYVQNAKVGTTYTA